MGGSRRRLKRGKAPVRVRLPKIKKPAPPAVKLPDGRVIEWNRDASLRKNYSSAGLQVDPFLIKPRAKTNASSRGVFLEQGGAADGEEREADAVAAAESDLAAEGGGAEAADGGAGGEGEGHLSHELLATLGVVKRHPGAPPPRLTRVQRTVVGRLLAVHGADYKAMARDIKRNRMQHSPAQLRLLCERYLAHEKTLPDPQ
ncbi:unnamed protein product [Closterium sp. Yama58-4]|nr:unnamed protein product [Closterium sp. Yama58-4]